MRKKNRRKHTSRDGGTARQGAAGNSPAEHTARRAGLTPIKVGIGLAIVMLGSALLLRPALRSRERAALSGVAPGTTQPVAEGAPPAVTGLPPPAPGTRVPLNDVDPVTGKPLTPASPMLSYKGYSIGFCCGDSSGYKGGWERMSENDKDAFVRKYLAPGKKADVLPPTTTPPAPTPAATPQKAAPSAAAPPADDPPPVTAQTPATTEPTFTGRYRIGPAEAPIRIVMFTDYQCEDCYMIESQLVNLHDTRTDISISIKHFPFNSECNPELKSTMHQNACWAARAAEAAGKLWGPEGFWKMHVWLFSRKGVFETTQQLESGIREIGYDPTGFTQVMSADDTLQTIKADVAEAKQLGLFFTPMIFINGVELKGWIAPNALIRSVEQLAAANLPARSAAFDRPAMAFEKYVADWREQPLLTLPPDKQAWTLGPDSATVKIVLWGDYQEVGSTQADAAIRALAAGRNDVQYTYRHYPFNSDCNPQLTERRFPNACRAAQAAEAAGKLGGSDGFWKMHAWLMDNREEFSDATLRRAATQMGLDADALFAALDQPDLQANILDDIQAGKQLPQLRHGMPAGLYGIPTIFVNGRYVPRWQLDDRPVLKEIVAEAAK